MNNESRIANKRLAKIFGDIKSTSEDEIKDLKVSSHDIDTFIGITANYIKDVAYFHNHLILSTMASTPIKDFTDVPNVSGLLTGIPLDVFIQGRTTPFSQLPDDIFDNIHQAIGLYYLVYVHKAMKPELYGIDNVYPDGVYEYIEEQNHTSDIDFGLLSWLAKNLISKIIDDSDADSVISTCITPERFDLPINKAVEQRFHMQAIDDMISNELATASGEYFKSVEIDDMTQLNFPETYNNLCGLVSGLLDNYMIEYGIIPYIDSRDISTKCMAMWMVGQDQCEVFYADKHRLFTQKDNAYYNEPFDENSILIILSMTHMKSCMV